MKKLFFIATFLLFIQKTIFAQFYIKNNAPFTIWAAIGYHTTSGWVSKGWYKIEPTTTVNVLNHGLSYNRYYCYYAYDEDGNYWKGQPDCTNCTNFLVDPAHEFTLSVNGDETGYERKRFKTIDIGIVNSYTLNLGGDNWSSGNCQNGYGTYKWVAQSKKYTGNWVNGSREGTGTCEYGKFHTTHAGCKFEGEWKQNEWYYGTLTWSNGNYYKGYFSNAKRNGKGTYTYADGSEYEGNWVDDKRSGKGTMVWAQEHKRYTGNWVNDVREGQGEAIYDEQNDKLPNWKFKGTWAKDTWKNGTVTYANGSKYVGDFQGIQRQGQGKLYNEAGELVKSGQWEADELVTSDAVKPEITWDAPLESNSVSTSATFELKACIKARDLKTVQLYLNGQQVGLNKGWSLEDNCSQSLQTKISLKAGTNTTYIVATNDAGKTQSVVRTIQYQTPTPTPAPMPTPTPVPSPTTANYYALVIGVQDYTDVSIADLQHPISDGERLKTVLLDKYTFLPNNIFNLKNPTKQDLVTALERLQKTITSKDYLLIFYSGHGTMQGEEGYWMLSDAQSSTTYHWLSSSELNTYIKRFKAKHILLISDACYSGSLLMRSAESAIQQQTCAVLEATPSRFAMTSGAKTVVPDNSVFMTYLLKQLLENRQTCISAEQVYMNIKNPIILNSPNQQIPQFGNIHATGSEGGGFIFKLK